MLTNLASATIIALAGLQSDAERAATGPATPAPAGAHVSVIPKDLSIAERLDFARQRLGELDNETAFPSDAQRTGERRAVWTQYVDTLEKLARLKARVAETGSQQYVEGVSKEIQTLKDATQQIKAGDVEFGPDKSALTYALDEIAARIAALTQVLAERESRLAELAADAAPPANSLNLSFRRKMRAQELTELRGQRAEAPPDDADPVEQKISNEVLDVRIATLERTVDIIKLEREETQLLLEIDRRLLEALKVKSQALEEFQTRFAKAESETRLGQLDEERAKALIPWQVALVDLKALSQRITLAYTKLDFVESVSPLYSTEAEIDALRERFSRELQSWDPIKQTAEYLASEDLQYFADQVARDLPALRERIRNVSGRLARSLRGTRTLSAFRERANRQIAAAEEHLTRMLEGVDVARAGPAQAEASRIRMETLEPLRKAAEQSETYGRLLANALEVFEQHVPKLQAVRDSLLWRRLLSRGNGLLETEWRVVLSELHALLEGFAAHDVESAAGITTAPARLLPVEPRDPESTRARAAEMRARLAASGDDFDTASLIRLAVGTIVMVFAASVIRRAAHRRGGFWARRIREIVDRDPQKGERVGHGVSARFNLFGLNIVGDMSIPAAILGAAALASFELSPDESVRRILWLTVGTVFVCVLLFRTVHHFFEKESRWYRVLLVDDAAAQHWRRWLKAVVLFCALMLYAASVLKRNGLAPGTVALIYNAHAVGLLLLMLGLFFQRRRVLAAVATPGATLLRTTLISLAQPIITLSLVALFVLHLCGYGALVAYLGLRALATIGTIVAIAAVCEYVVDWFELMRERDRQPSPADRVAGTAGADKRENTTDRAAVTFGWTVRILGLFAVVVMVMRTWELALPAGGNAWDTVLGVLAILLALVIVDGLAHGALQRLEATRRLPTSVVRIGRRSLRAILAVVGVLVFVAVAGFETESLWSFVTATLAMIAIGFVAVWSILSNFLATLVLIVWRPFRVGEIIELIPDGVEGRVVDINFMYTVLETKDGVMTSVPNNQFAQKMILRKRTCDAPARSLAEQLDSDTALTETAAARTD